MPPLKRKIEDRAITAIRQIIDAHPTMEDYFNKRDKELSWDGFIRLYLNDEEASDKANFDDDVPVQIKGHVDENRKKMKKERITESVDLDDLRVYYRKSGCLYFVVYMTEDGSEAEVFYSSLFPSKIKAILDEAERRHNVSSISIPFLKLAKDSKELYLLCKQFSFEVTKQGSGNGQIVPRSITGNDLQQVKQITATTVGGVTPYDLLNKINTGDIVFYGTIDDSGIQYPMQIYGMVASVKDIIEMPISVGEKQYYSSFEVKDTVTAPDAKNYVRDSTVTVKPSPNLKFTLKGKNISFEFQFETDILQIKHDAEFLLELLDKKEITIFGARSEIGNARIDARFSQQLHSIIEAGRALEDIGCNILIPIKDLTDEDRKQIDLLCSIRDGNVLFNTDKKVFLYNWEFREKLWPIVVDLSGKKVKLSGYVFNLNFVFSIGSPDGKEREDGLPPDAYIVPNFLRLAPDLLANLYWYDYEAMFAQVDRSVVNEATIDELNNLALNLIKAYDLNGSEKLLDVAEEILRRLYERFPKAVYCIVNAFQIEVRKNGALSDDSCERLDRMAEEMVYEAPTEGQADISRVFGYCCAVLKGEIERADELYATLTDADRTGVDNWPIRMLHLKEIHKP